MALDYFRKFAAFSVADAQYSLGYAYLYGVGTEPDLDEALRWLNKATDQGHLQAAALLAEHQKEKAC